MGAVLPFSQRNRSGAVLVPGDYVTNALRAAIGVVVAMVGESVCLVDWPGTSDDRREATVNLLPVTIWRDDAAEHGVDELFGGTV